MMRVSRWGWSPYETMEDRAREAEEVSRVADVVADQTDAEVVVVHSKVEAGRSLIRDAPSMKLLVTTTSGTDHIDLGAMADAGVSVCRLPLARRDAVVEASLGMLIWGMRRFGQMSAWGEAGHWGRGDLPALEIPTVRGARVGVVGLGVIGSEMASRLRMLGATVYGVDPMVEIEGCTASSLDEVFNECDAVTLHCSLNATTRGFVNERRIQAARRGLVLVNTARGPLVDVPAAVAAARAGQLGALCLDVFPVEPTDLKEFTSPNVFVSPHAAGMHRDLSRRVREGLSAAIRSFDVTGQPPYSVAR